MLWKEKGILYRRQDKELLCIEAWGEHGLRIRATENSRFQAGAEDLGALEENKTGGEALISIEGNVAAIRNGKIRCVVCESGKIRFYSQSGRLLLEEYERNSFGGYDSETAESTFNSSLAIRPRSFQPVQGTDHCRLTVRFEADPKEKIYGLGQYQQPGLNRNGCILELAHRNSQASIPFLISDKGYGMLWNNPAVGRVVFGSNRVEWEAYSTRQMDYWITAGDTPAEILESYADVSGKVPMMPDYAMGFWQSKLRYRTQEELLETAREYKRRGLPLDVIVADYFHWPNQGDFRFDPDYWPDPKGMTEELERLGVRLMVSVWPTAEEGSENYREMTELGLLTRNDYGDRSRQLGNASVIDVTNPATRSYVWEKLKKNYYRNGIDLFWLDEAEPEFDNYEYSIYRYYLGADLDVGNIYPREYARMVYDGLKAEGKEDVIHLIRCAWAGSQKFGGLLWSGDIDSSFRALREQLAAGLNTGLAGIPWWTTDIGGFEGADVRDEKFRELLIRWFQFAAFCPVLRMHGFRKPVVPPIGVSGGGSKVSGSPNEIWSYGEDTYEILKKYLLLRQDMRPYIRKCMEEAHEKGTPVIRPLFYDFPEDHKCWETEDEFMFGPDMLVCPVLYEGMRRRTVYLPEGNWQHLGSGEILGGGIHDVDAPLCEIPVFVRR